MLGFLRRRAPLVPVAAVVARPAPKGPVSKNKAALIALVGSTAAATLSTEVPKVEGTILRGYRDPIGIVTACTGHTATAVLGRPYTAAECADLLDQDLASHAKGVMACIHVPTSAGERAAYVSFGFNVGVGAFCRSTIARRLNAGDHAGACDGLRAWTRAGTKTLPGLVKRREIERSICLDKDL